MPRTKENLKENEGLDAGIIFERMMGPKITLTLRDVEPSPMGTTTLGALLVENGPTVAPMLRAFWNRICDLLEQPPEERSAEEVLRLVQISRTELASALQMMVALNTIEKHHPHFFKYLRENYGNENSLFKKEKFDEIVIDLYGKMELKHPTVSRRSIAKKLGINPGQLSNYLRKAGPLGQEKVLALAEYCAKLLAVPET